MNMPIDPKYFELMNAVAEVLDETFNVQGVTPKKMGFVLLTFPFGDHNGGRCNYISNGANRADIISMFKEMIARFEGMPFVPPGSRQ